MHMEPIIDKSKPQAITHDGKKIDIRVFSHIVLQPSRAILTTLELSGVQFEWTELCIRYSDHKSAEFLAVNPKGSIPTVMIDGKVYVDMAKTIRLLAELLPSLKSYYPDDLSKRHAINAALVFNRTVYQPAMRKRNLAYCAQRKNENIVTPEIQGKIDETENGIFVVM